MSTTVSMSIDLEAPGKNPGYLSVGDSTNNSGWTSHQVPIISFKNGSGPTVLIIGGTHGDEYEGQIAAAALSRNLNVAEVSGRIIIIPCISLEASRMGNRLWSDGTDFNQVFPGNERGALHGKLAHFLSNELFPQCDAIVDLHSGGRSLYFIPNSTMNWVDDLSERVKRINNTLPWNTPAHLITAGALNTDSRASLSENVQAQGRSLATGKFGGAGYTSPHTVRTIKAGLENFLRSFGVLKGVLKTREEMGQAAPQILDIRKNQSLVSATRAGIYENLLPLGAKIKTGEIVGLIHDVDHPDILPAQVSAECDGVLVAVRGLPPVVAGDIVAVIGREWQSFQDVESAS